MNLQGQSIFGSESHAGTGANFSAFNPATGEALAPVFQSATIEDLHAAVQLAEDAFRMYGKLSGKDKGKFLRHIAAGIEGIANDLVERAHLETALPKKRLQGEVARTANQLRLFALVVEEGSWRMARIDTGDAARTPLPKPDIRSQLQPLGPVAIFGASNFPLAFSVAGGDTASALAAGNPVIVKAHPSHPGTSELVGQVICQSVRDCGLPPGVFSLLFDAGTQIGAALVQHPFVKAVGFTGSLTTGKELMQLAASRPEPIPCYAEMGSTNPLFVLPAALKTRGSQIAKGFFESFTLGVGQFCTKPGMIFLPDGKDTDSFLNVLKALVQQASAGIMLNKNICSNYTKAVALRKRQKNVRILAEAVSLSAENLSHACPVIFEVGADDWIEDQELAEEIFGPATLVIRYKDREQLQQLARALQGHLTATLHETDNDLLEFGGLIEILERKVGRLLLNGFPTGVEVCHAMVHGGPYPATSDGRSTSVGSQAICRFTRPMCYQDFPQSALPDELKNSNPLGILRLLNGEYTRTAVE